MISTGIFIRFRGYSVGVFPLLIAFRVNVSKAAVLKLGSKLLVSDICVMLTSLHWATVDSRVRQSPGASACDNYPADRLNPCLSPRNDLTPHISMFKNFRAYNQIDLTFRAVVNRINHNVDPWPCRNIDSDP
jgi:hypothetical protein